MTDLDIDMGIARRCIGDDRALLKQLQTYFIGVLTDFMATFRQALTEESLEHATRMAHTLKGTAGTLGAVRVQQTAAALEAACRGAETSPPSVEPLLVTLEAAMGRVRVALEQMVQAEPEPSLAPLPLAKLVPVLYQLRRSLAESDTASCGLLRQLAETAEHPVHGNALKRIVTAVNNYDFPAGLNEVDALLSTLGA